MKVGVISDTHDHVIHIEQIVLKFKELQIDTLLHAGDYCSPFTIPPFQDFNFIGVFGNNDGDHYRLIQKFREIGGEIHNEFHEMEIDGKKIALYHGTREPIKEALIGCGKYDLVVSGHNHIPVNEMYGNTLSFNPGTAHGFGKRATIGVYDTTTAEAEHIELK